MPIDEYLKHKKEAKKRHDTILRNYRLAYDLAEATTIGPDKLVDLEKLTEQKFRSKFENTLLENLVAEAKIFLDVPSNVDYDVYQTNTLLLGYYGFDATEAHFTVEKLKNNLNYDSMLKELSEKIKPRLESILQTPLNFLSQDDAEKVVKYTKTAGDVDPTKLSIGDMAQLLDIYEAGGVIPPKFLEGKLYKR